MTNCYTVTLAEGVRFVAATSVEDALGQVPGATAAERTFPWLDDIKVEVDEDAPDGTDNTVAGQGLGAHPRTAEVRDWVKGYTGRNDFVLNIQFRLADNLGHGVTKKRARLTYKQVAALAAAKDREAAWAVERERAAKDPSGIDIRSAVPAGTWRTAAPGEDGKLAFVRIDSIDKGKWAGWVFVKAILGPSDDKRLGSQRPDAPSYVGSWTTVLTNIVADFEAAVERYGLEVGECGACGKRLTNEESRQGGIGPVCRAKMRGLR